jgi:hypothetical protein
MWMIGTFTSNLFQRETPCYSLAQSINHREKKRFFKGIRIPECGKEFLSAVDKNLFLGSIIDKRNRIVV